jgi:hypothetical protein
MKYRMIVAAATLSLVAAPALAQKSAGQNRRAAWALSAPAEQAAIAFALQRGRLLFGLDRAAWVATDDFVARMPNYQSQGARGYVVELAPGGYVVTFLGGPQDAPVAFYRADVRENRVHSSEVFPAAARPALTPAQRRLLDARNAAAAAVRGRSCNGRPFNSAVIPPAAPDGPIDVYLLTPQLEEGQYPLGGHFRITVGPDGRAGRERAFTNSCLLMRMQDVPGGGQIVSMNVTHLLDPVPTEIHVFTALTSGLSVYVGIGSPLRLYNVTGEAIRRVQ